MEDRLTSTFIREYMPFGIGIVFILLSMGSIYFGACPGRGGTAYRSKEPTTFWFGVIIYFAAGVFLCIRFFYRFI